MLYGVAYCSLNCILGGEMKKATAALLILCLSLFISTSVWAQKTTYTTKDGLDNIEEYVSDGSWDSGSSDLEIGYEKPGEADQEQQIIGVRFQGVTIPAADEIAKAYIQFTQDEDKNQSPFSATIRGQAIGDAPPFQEVTYAVSSREKQVLRYPGRIFPSGRSPTNRTKTSRPRT